MMLCATVARLIAGARVILTGSFNFAHLMNEVLSAGFLHCDVTVFPFVINKHLMEKSSSGKEKPLAIRILCRALCLFCSYNFLLFCHSRM